MDDSDCFLDDLDLDVKVTGSAPTLASILDEDDDDEFDDDDLEFLERQPAARDIVLQAGPTVDMTASPVVPRRSMPQPQQPAVQLQTPQPPVPEQQQQQQRQNREQESSDAHKAVEKVAGAAQTVAAPAVAPDDVTLRRNKHGKVLRGLLLTRLSQHLSSTPVRREVGSPTVLAVRGVLVLGTTHGYVLVYDAKQHMTMMLGTTSHATQFGAATAVSLNHDSTRLLVGHERGQIVRWDLMTGKIVNQLNDVYPQKSPILYVAFVDGHTAAISNDSQGSMFLHEFKKVMGMRMVDHTCLYTSKPGEGVCCIKMLDFEACRIEPPRPVSVVAVGMLHKVEVCFLKPEHKIAIRISRQEADGSLMPSLAWNFVPIRGANQQFVVDPVLAFSWGRNVRFMQMSILVNEKKPTDFRALGTYRSKATIISVRWLTDKTIMTMDTQERIHVVDVRAMTLVDVVDLSQVELVFNTKFSQVNFRHARLRAYEHSLATMGGNVYVLGVKSVHVVSLMSWKERVSYLVNQSKFVQALELTYSFHQDRALAVAGLPTERRRRRAMVRQHLITLLQAYVDISLSVPHSSDAAAFYGGVALVVITYALGLEAHQELFAAIYDKFATNAVAQAQFLELIEPLIKEDKVRALSPTVMKDFVEHYQALGKLETVEQCILHMEVRNLDIHQVVIMCWTHGLYDAIIYVYSQGLADYTTPLQEISRILQAAVRKATQAQARVGNCAQLLSVDEQRLGYKLLLYISCCLAGRAFPTGDIPLARVGQVKWEVYKHIISRTSEQRDKDVLYPYTRTLLQFDTQEFLNVLSMAFEQEEEQPDGDVDTPMLPKRQVVVDILLQIMVVEPQKNNRQDFSPEQIGSLFTFLARQMARHEGSIIVDKQLFELVLDYLSNPKETSQHEERQQALLELLSASGLQQFDQARLLRLAHQAHFYRVCQLVYTKTKQYAKIVDCYLLDTARQQQVFSFVHSTLADGSIDPAERASLQAATKERTAKLAEIDAVATARLILLDFSVELEALVARLPEPVLQYKVLTGVFALLPTLQAEELIFPSEVHELYVELMCRLEPTSVYAYLRQATDFRVDECLQICKRHAITDATALLLERSGDTLGAFALIMETLRQRMQALNKNFEGWESALKQQRGSGNLDMPDDGRGQALTALRSILAVAIQMCLRASAREDEAGREGLWFPLLDELINSQRRMKTRLKLSLAEYTMILRELTRHVVNTMIGFVALPAILQKIMSDTSLTRSFGEIKDLILGMLETYNYEETLLQTTNRIVSNDLYWAMMMRRAAAHKGVLPRSLRCELCRRTLDGFGTITLFACGHSFHSDCAREGECLICESSSRRSGRAPRRADIACAPPTSSFSLRELAVEETREPATPQKEHCNFMTAFQQRQLKKFKAASKTMPRLALLEQLDAYADGQGVPPIPDRALSRREDFALSRAPPNKTVERRPRVAGCLPEAPRNVNTLLGGLEYL